MAFFVALNILAVESEFAPCLLELAPETFDGDLYNRIYSGCNPAM